MEITKENSEIEIVANEQLLEIEEVSECMVASLQSDQ